MNTLYLILLLLLTIIAIGLSVKSSLLRDEITKPDTFNQIVAQKGIANPKAPFSLARTQVAFWTVIIVSSFIYVLIHLDYEVPELNNANLILLGISIGTIATAKLIDDSQREFHRHQNEPSQGFFTDLISDGNGVSIHRLQNVLWTLVVGWIYIHYVCVYRVLPDESVITDQLLTLMGISELTYVGLKVTENKSTQVTDTTNAPASELGK